MFTVVVVYLSISFYTVTFYPAVLFKKVVLYLEIMCSGGGFVSGYLSSLLLYLPFSWRSVQRVLIGFSRLSNLHVNY